MTDYDTHYRRGRGQCGAPFPELVQFFEQLETSGARVLDLGCGQGRDALMIARLGHGVVGVDLSAVGIEQLREDAEAEGLDITAVVGDVLAFTSRRKFDVVVLDRVLHMLPTPADRIACLERATRLTRKHGFVLTADTPTNRQRIRDFFADRSDRWTVILQRKGLVFARKDHA